MIDKQEDDNNMDTYIGCKIIEAKQMDECTFLKEEKGQDVSFDDREAQAGYKVKYPNGYISWSPKKVFEEAYRKVNKSEVEMCEKSVNIMNLKKESVLSGDKIKEVYLDDNGFPIRLISESGKILGISDSIEWTEINIGY